MEDTQKRNLPVQRILTATLDVAGFRLPTGPPLQLSKLPCGRAKYRLLFDHCSLLFVVLLTNQRVAKIVLAAGQFI